MLLIDPLVAVSNWLMQPISGASIDAHQVSASVSWHGRLMVLSWGLILPLGVLAARFFKVTPGQDWPRVLDNPTWWRIHWRGQSLGVFISLVGVSLICGKAHGQGALEFWHQCIGWALFALGLIQITGGFFRGSKGGPTAQNLRGDHYDMTRRRRIFEFIHKSIGYFALFLALCNVVTGLILADAPRWMLLLLLSSWVAMLTAFVVLQIKGYCVPTYQAIWGLDTRHPGNRSLGDFNKK
jgi:Eukaryotic cytochrome b561